MKTACIYARVSSTGDRQDTARQVDDLTDYAQRNNIEIIRTFTEKASGAKSRKERPILNECLVYCVSHKIDLLLVSELSRLGRNTIDVLQNINFAKEAQLNIFFQKEGLSIFTNDGKPHPFLTMLIAVLSAAAEMERENISYRLQSGRDRYIRNGGKMGRKEGYRKTIKDYERDYPAVFKELRRKDRESYDRISKITGASKNTIITIARLLGLTRDQQEPEPITLPNQKPEE
ncbi:MAG: recombinase family protein [Alistipes sp.]|nr:recombinase family protein [Bacteroidales bacterium]MBR5492491.1 recombinase family protein [Alistipes sp.]MBR5920058.1 recombinase family protein [Bacteroidales bacterium]